AADRLLQKPQGRLLIAVLGQQKVDGLTLRIDRPIERAPLTFDLNIRLIDVIVTTHKNLALVFHTQVYKLKRERSKKNLPAAVSSFTVMQNEGMEVHDENPAHSLPTRGSRSAPGGATPQSTQDHSGTSGGPQCKER